MSGRTLLMKRGMFHVLAIIAASSGVVLLCVLIQACAVAVCVRWYVRFIPLEGQPLRPARMVGVMFLIVMCLLAGHLLQIACWGAFFFVLDVFADFQTALYFAGVTFATIGYGDVVLPPGRYLLGPLVGITGLLMAGVSTAVMAAAVMNMINRRLTHLRERRKVEKNAIAV